MNAYIPPMTGLEAHMEEEVAKQARRADEALQQAQQGRELHREAKPALETEADRRTEEAMLLGR